MSDTLNALSAEFRLNRGNRARTSHDTHFMVRRLLGNIMDRLQAAGTDMTKLTGLLNDLGSNTSDIASGISGVAPNRENTPQAGNIRDQGPGARVDYPDGARGPLGGNVLNADGTVRNADGTPLSGAPGHPDRETLNADGSVRVPNESLRNPDGTIHNADGTLRADIPGRAPGERLGNPSGTPGEFPIPRNPDGSQIHP